MADPEDQKKVQIRARSQENPLANILINVLIPVFALSILSKSGDRPWHLGPVLGMLIAVALPVAYGSWYLFKFKRFNFFSILGIISVLLTGGLTIYLWEKDGTVKSSAPVLFALKEAAIPLMFGITILGSWWTRNPLVRVFLYNPDIFDVAKIESRIAERSKQIPYRKLLFQGNLWMALSFFISTGMNFFLAIYFLEGATGSREAYNSAVGKLTGWGFLVIGVPITVMLIVIMIRLVKKLENLTGLERDDIIMPR